MSNKKYSTKIGSSLGRIGRSRSSRRNLYSPQRLKQDLKNSKRRRILLMLDQSIQATPLTKMEVGRSNRMKHGKVILKMILRDFR